MGGGAPGIAGQVAGGLWRLGAGRAHRGWRSTSRTPCRTWLGRNCR